MYRTVLEAAQSQIGQHNDKDGSNKYNRWYYGYRSTAPWCAVFISWCFDQAGIYSRLSGLNNKAGCDPYMRWGKSLNLWGYKPAIGSLVLYDWDNDGSADHIGIVESYGAGYIIAVEGNTSVNGSQSNGGYVLRKKRYLSDVLGFINIDTRSDSLIHNIYGEGKVSSPTGCRICARPEFGSGTEELIPYNETVYCFGTNFNQGYEWWRVDSSGKRWVRKTSLRDRIGYKKRGAVAYGSGIVTSKTGVRIHSAPGMKYATEEVRPYDEELYCFATHVADGYEWWCVDPNRLKWVRKTSLSNRKGFRKIIEF